MGIYKLERRYQRKRQYRNRTKTHNRIYHQNRRPSVRNFSQQVFRPRRRRSAQHFRYRLESRRHLQPLLLHLRQSVSVVYASGKNQQRRLRRLLHYGRFVFVVFNQGIRLRNKEIQDGRRNGHYQDVFGA